MKTLGLILARGQSKRIQNKNLVELGGKPLINWTIECAQRSKCLNRIILSTDCDQIAETARKAGCEVPFMRPNDLAGDHSTATQVVLHALDRLGEDFDAFVLLQPTSPFRLPEDIEQAIAQLESSSADSVFGVMKSKYHPMHIFKEEGGWARPWIEVKTDLSNIRTQDLPPAYVINGAIYAARIPAYQANPGFFGKRSIFYEMPAERSLDIDGPADLEYARYLANTLK